MDKIQHAHKLILNNTVSAAPGEIVYHKGAAAIQAAALTEHVSIQFNLFAEYNCKSEPNYNELKEMTTNDLYTYFIEHIYEPQ